jgi:hypothetical protein
MTYLDAENVKQDKALAAINHELKDLDDEIDETKEGVAMALAMAMPMLPDWKTAAISANFGTFEGESAFAVAGVVRVDHNIAVHGGVGVGLDQGTTGGRVGVSFGW